MTASDQPSNVHSILRPNRFAISNHLFTLFSPGFVRAYSEAFIEVAYGPPDRGPARGRWFSAFDLAGVCTFAETVNLDGNNVYVVPALLQGEPGGNGRSTNANYLDSAFAWADADKDFDRVRALLEQLSLVPTLTIITGTQPERRTHFYFGVKGPLKAAELQALNRAIAVRLGTDEVSAPCHLMRLAGTISYPNTKKAASGYVPEVVTVDLGLKPIMALPLYGCGALLEMLGVKPDAAQSPADDPWARFAAEAGTRKGREDGELYGLLEASRQPGHWHNSIRDAIATMVGRGWEEMAIRATVGPYCEHGQVDPDLDPLIDSAVRKWGRTETERKFQTGTSSYRADANGSQARGSAPPRQVIAATPFVWRPIEDIPRRDWVYGNYLIRRFGSAKIAGGGVGKSNLLIAEALALVTGRNLLGVEPPHPMRVWMWNGEDPMEELERRIRAACQHYKITEGDIGGRLFVNSGRVTEIIVATQDRTGTKIAHPVVAELTATIIANQIDVVQIDPFVSCHRVSENDNGAIDQVAKAWTGIADATNSAVDLVHHIRKNGLAEVTIEDARGAVSLINAVRAAVVLNKMSREDGETLGLEQSWRYFRLTNGKQNLAPWSDKDDWFCLQSVRLANGPVNDPTQGDSVGVVTTWERPSALEGVTGALFEEASRIIRRGTPSGGGWRESCQSPDWVGYAIGAALGVTDLGAGQKPNRARVKGVLNAWLRAGSLVIVRREDKTRRERAFVEVAEDQ